MCKSVVQLNLKNGNQFSHLGHLDKVDLTWTELGANYSCQYWVFMWLVKTSSRLMSEAAVECIFTKLLSSHIYHFFGMASDFLYSYTTYVCYYAP